MLFNSYVYIFLFLPITAYVFFQLNYLGKTEASKYFVVAASLFFYAWWNIIYLPLIVFSILFNYFLAKKILSGHSHKFTFVSVLLVNLGFLGMFKYADFTIENINFIANANIEPLGWALPLAISFFTLQQVAFQVDCQQGLIKKVKFLDYAFFVSYFPQLIAGPIVRFKELIPQVEATDNKLLNTENLARGTCLFFLGLFKKVVFADELAIIADNGFDSAVDLTLIEAWITALSFTFQLYFDFSGYSDMAIGAALVFNIKLPINFNSPYKSKNLIDFWQRWHITLSKFITVYIYTPMYQAFGHGNFAMGLVVMLLAMIISGVWHGAAWTFIIWGFLHGIGLMVNHSWRKKKIKIPYGLAWAITFVFVVFVNVLFRARGLADAQKVYEGMVGFSGINLPHAIASRLQAFDFIKPGDTIFNLGVNSIDLYILALAIPVTFFLRNSTDHVKNLKFNTLNLLIFSLVMFYSTIMIARESAFIYFNF